MNQYKILTTGPADKPAADIFDARDDVTYEALDDLSEANLLEKMKDADAIYVRRADITAKIIENSPRLKCVARVGVGYDSVDVSAMTKRGLPLMTTGTANSTSVAEAALYMMLELAKDGFRHDQAIRAGNWNYRTHQRAHEIFGTNVLIVGFGRIGSRVAPRCLGFGMKVFVCDPYIDESVITAAGCTPVSDLHAALPDMDFVTMHTPLNDETRFIIDRRELDLMKDSAILVNCARGNIVNEDALYEVMSDGKLRGAGLDVFAQEPAPADHPLFTLENIVISPHNAGVTAECNAQMSAVSAQNILDVFDRKPNPNHVVNKEVLVHFK